MKRKKSLVALLMVLAMVAVVGGVQFGPQIADAVDKVKYSIHLLEVYKIKAFDPTNYPVTIGSSSEPVTINASSLTLAGTQTSITGVTTFRRDAMVINSRSQLTNLAGDTGVAGLSAYQTQVGKRYIIDLYALASYTSGTSITGAVSGLTLFLPNASSANSEGTVTIELAATGGVTGYEQWMGSAAGTSAVWIYPYSAGTTSYAKGTAKPQTLQTYAMDLQGVTKTVVNYNMAAGTSFWSLDHPGESAVFGLLYNSQVSAYPIRVHTIR